MSLQRAHTGAAVAARTAVFYMARRQLHNLRIHSRVPQSGSVQQATWRGGEATPGHSSADEPNSRKSTDQTRVGRGGGGVGSGGGGGGGRDEPGRGRGAGCWGRGGEGWCRSIGSESPWSGLLAFKDLCSVQYNCNRFTPSSP